MTHHDTPPARQNPRRRLRAAWCACGCEFDPQDVVYMPDHVCPCGVEKHHYHCPACLGITQVG